MKPSWLPDWTNPNNYPDPNNTTRLEWAWQFLRRNPEYRRLWADWIQPHYDRAHLQWGLDRIPAKFRGVSDRVRRHVGEPVYWDQLGRFSQGFGISTIPPNPAEPNAMLRFAPLRYAQKPSGRPGVKPGLVYPVPGAIEDHEVVVWFDRDRPIEPQLKKAKE